MRFVGRTLLSGGWRGQGKTTQGQYWFPEGLSLLRGLPSRHELLALPDGLWRIALEDGAIQEGGTRRPNVPRGRGAPVAEAVGKWKFLALGGGLFRGLVGHTPFSSEKARRGPPITPPAVDSPYPARCDFPPRRTHRHPVAHSRAARRLELRRLPAAHEHVGRRRADDGRPRAHAGAARRGAGGVRLELRRVSVSRRRLGRSRRRAQGARDSSRSSGEPAIC